jgi:hypothetical protein
MLRLFSVLSGVLTRNEWHFAVRSILPCRHKVYSLGASLTMQCEQTDPKSSGVMARKLSHCAGCCFADSIPLDTPSTLTSLPADRLVKFRFPLSENCVIKQTVLVQKAKKRKFHCCRYGNRYGEYTVSSNDNWLVYPIIGHNRYRLRITPGKIRLRVLNSLRDAILCDTADAPTESVVFLWPTATVFKVYGLTQAKIRQTL